MSYFRKFVRIYAGKATVCRNDDGEIYWNCEVDAVEGSTESPTIELRADTFAVGTVVRIYKPTDGPTSTLGGK